MKEILKFLGKVFDWEMDKALWSFIAPYVHNKLLHNWRGPFSDNSTFQWDQSSWWIT